MINSVKTKNELRNNAIKKRLSMAELPLNKINSDKIVQKIIFSSDFKNAKNIALYYPIKNEVNLLKLLEFKDKNFYFPKCLKNNEMEFYKADSMLDFTLGAYNINEPNGERINPSDLDLIYVPALMANTKNYRLGYGKGFYDRFFSKYKVSAKKIIVLLSDFISDNFHEDAFDCKCDYIMSEIFD